MPWTNKIVSDVVNLGTNTKGEQDAEQKRIIITAPEAASVARLAYKQLNTERK